MSPWLSGATPNSSTDFSKPSGQVAARWPLPSEVFAPFASIPERTPLAITMHKISQQAEVKPTNWMRSGCPHGLARLAGHNPPPLAPDPKMRRGALYSQNTLKTWSQP